MAAGDREGVNSLPSNVYVVVGARCDEGLPKIKVFSVFTKKEDAEKRSRVISGQQEKYRFPCVSIHERRLETFNYEDFR